jgi:hypothetical protein
MQFDRVVIDILDWIRRVLFWRSHRQVKQKPYEILKIERLWRGILKLVKRDTPRAVRTWIFTPFPIPENGLNTVSRQNIKDYHICLDHLLPLVGDNRAPVTPPSSSMRHRPTHRVMVLEASRYLTSDGSYASSTLFSCDYSFARRDGSRDRWAIAVVDELAKIVGNGGIQDVDWHMEIELSRKRFLDVDYYPCERPEPAVAQQPAQQ